jgi:beta-lactamase regulating signal transducer with metallopeptidase domain
MELFIYLFKINVAIMLFYFIYRLIFQQDTFFAWKRILLLSMVIFAFIYPLFDFWGWFVDDANLDKINSLATISIDAATVNFSVAETQKTISFGEIVLLIAKIIYFSGVIFIFLRIFGQILSVLNIFKNSEKQNIFQNQVLVSENINAPFSFFGKIIFNPKNYSESEINEILLHENLHVRQLHSFDTMLAEILCAFAWFNPFAWFLKREIRLNLEFLADKNVVSAGCELQNYQLNLLRISCQNRTKITNNFNFSPIKKRIVMLKKNQTKSAGVLKYALLLPIFAVLFGVNQSIMSQDQKSNELTTIYTFKEWKKYIKVAEKVDVLPQFAGGEKALYKFIADNFQKPYQPQEDINILYIETRGLVPITFTVDVDGTIKNIQSSPVHFSTRSRTSINSAEALIKWFEEEEAVRVASVMPKWKPAKLNGKPVQTTVNMYFPYRFIDETPIIYMHNEKQVTEEEHFNIIDDRIDDRKLSFEKNQVFNGKTVHIFKVTTSVGAD